jgi:hypothetical protein
MEWRPGRQDAVEILKSGADEIGQLSRFMGHQEAPLNR